MSQISSDLFSVSMCNLLAPMQTKHMSAIFFNVVQTIAMSIVFDSRAKQTYVRLF